MKTEQNLRTERSIVIDADSESIWDVLTNPRKIKLYLFGSEVVTDWRIGSPGKLLKYTYWSS